jgi:hypothetical protein
MIRYLVALAMVLHLSAFAVAEPNPRYAKEIQLPEFNGEGLVAAPLDSEIYQATGNGFDDLRVLNSEGGEVAFVLRKVPVKEPHTTKQTWRAANLALKPQADGGLEIQIDSDLEKHPDLPQGLRFRTHLRNFEHRVRVEASADGTNWQTVLEDGLIFDYSQYMDVRDLSLNFAKVPLPEFGGKRAYFRITIEQVTQEQQSQLMELTRNLRGPNEERRSERVIINRQPLRLEGIDFWRDEVRNDVVSDLKQVYSLKVTKTVQDDETKRTYVYLESSNEPITEVHVDTPDRNFSREARLEFLQPGGARALWKPLGSATLIRIDIQSLQRESLEIEFPESRHPEYRLVIENADSGPLKISDVSAEGNVYEVVFLGTEGSDYQIAYGGQDLATPNYDTAALTAALDEGLTAKQASLGAVEQLPLAPPPIGAWILRLLNNGPVIVAVVAALVCVLGFGLYRAVSRIDEIHQSS